MTDQEKIARMEHALRTERDTLRKLGGEENLRASNLLVSYLSKADADSLLRFANILMESDA